MKKILCLLLMILFVLNLSACNQKNLSKPDKGTPVDNLSLTLKSGDVINIDANTDYKQLYNIILENYNKNSSYEFTSKINKIDDEIIDETISGYFYNNVESQESYFKTDKNSLNLEVYFYSKQSSEMLYLVKNKNTPLYGGGNVNGKRLNFKNSDEIVPIIYPAASQITDKKTLENCEYLVNVDRIYRIIPNNILNGLYFEKYIDEFTYEISLTNKYIILSCTQPYGEYEPNGMYKDPAMIRKGEFSKVIYFNINTLGIDYVEVQSKTYNNPGGYQGLLFDYSYSFVITEDDLLKESIEDFLDYTKKHTEAR